MDLVCAVVCAATFEEPVAGSGVLCVPVETVPPIVGVAAPEEVVGDSDVSCPPLNRMAYACVLGLDRGPRECPLEMGSSDDVVDEDSSSEL